MRNIPLRDDQLRKEAWWVLGLEASTAYLLNTNACPCTEHAKRVHFSSQTLFLIYVSSPVDRAQGQQTRADLDFLQVWCGFCSSALPLF